MTEPESKTTEEGQLQTPGCRSRCCGQVQSEPAAAGPLSQGQTTGPRAAVSALGSRPWGQAVLSAVLAHTASSRHAPASLNHTRTSAAHRPTRETSRKSCKPFSLPAAQRPWMRKPPSPRTEPLPWPHSVEGPRGRAGLQGRGGRATCGSLRHSPGLPRGGQRIFGGCRACTLPLWTVLACG